MVQVTKTLGVIMGAFTVCWLPFFILALVRAFCHEYGQCAHAIPDWLNSLFLWLGFANSFLNPIIYARFNRDFRTPFKEILLCRCRDIDRRLRNESYAEQFGGGGGGTAATLHSPPTLPGGHASSSVPDATARGRQRPPSFVLTAAPDPGTAGGRPSTASSPDVPQTSTTTVAPDVELSHAGAGVAADPSVTVDASVHNGLR